MPSEELMLSSFEASLDEVGLTIPIPTNRDSLFNLMKTEFYNEGVIFNDIIDKLFNLFTHNNDANISSALHELDVSMMELTKIVNIMWASPNNDIHHSTFNTVRTGQLSALKNRYEDAGLENILIPITIYKDILEACPDSMKDSCCTVMTRLMYTHFYNATVIASLSMPQTIFQFNLQDIIDIPANMSEMYSIGLHAYLDIAAAAVTWMSMSNNLMQLANNTTVVLTIPNNGEFEFALGTEKDSTNQIYFRYIIESINILFKENRIVCNNHFKTVDDSLYIIKALNTIKSNAMTVKFNLSSEVEKSFLAFLCA